MIWYGIQLCPMSRAILLNTGQFEKCPSFPISHRSYCLPDTYDELYIVSASAIRRYPY